MADEGKLQLTRDTNRNTGTGREPGPIRGGRKLRTITAEHLRLTASHSRRADLGQFRNDESNRNEAIPVSCGSLADYDDGAPPRIPSVLSKAPRLKEIYWCQFPRDAELPEFWKIRPVVVLSRKADLKGTAFIVPCTSRDQWGSPDAVELSTMIGGQRTWAVCDKPVSVAVSRLRAPKGKFEVSDRELTAIVRKVALLMPAPIMSDGKRTQILRLLERRHGARIGGEFDVVDLGGLVLPQCGDLL